ncbi:MAG: oligoendopeptidase F [Sumerlaeia bacterium]
MAATSEAPATQRIPNRDDIPAPDRWNLEAIYATPDAWDADFRRIDESLKPLLALQGKLASAAALAECFRLEDAFWQTIDRLYSYAHHREDEDTGNSTNQARHQRVAAKVAEVRGKTAWIRPEILAHPEESLRAWAEDAALADYRRTMKELIRQKPHTLSDAEETLLSKASQIFATPYQTFTYLTNADMSFPDVKDEKGEAQPLSNGRFVTFLESKDRDVRRRAFETLYDTYIGYKNTLASTLGGSVKLNNYTAGIRHFDSALEAALHPDNVPVKLYDALIEAVHTALPAFHDYIDLRKEMLGLDQLDMYDQYVSLVPDYDMKVSWGEACEWVTRSCEPMGEEYLGGLKSAFSDRWIDVYENKGKRSGAYSGGCYSTHPYVLMNYQGTLDHVFTLAHELGHSMHTWLSHRKQPYRYADYTIFVAEIASTTNEALLLNYLLETTDDPKFRAYLLNHQCDQFKGTVFRQTQFAEFERILHEMDQSGEPLTAEAIAERYYELNAAYYGPGVKADPRIAYEWMRIPHFYYDFYVYKYATGFCAAQVFSQRILGDAKLRDQYLDFLRSGGSADPLDLVKMGGVDLTDPKVLTDAFETFKRSTAELRELLRAGV